MIFKCYNPWTAEEGADGSKDEFSESFAFALVNGALGVFEVHGRRIRDFRYSFSRIYDCVFSTF